MSDQTTIEVVLSSESTVGNPIIETVSVVGTVPIGPRGPAGVVTADDVVDLFAGTPDGTTFLRDDGTLATPAGGSGVVETVVAGSNIDVDATDPANPVVSVEALTTADISGLGTAATTAATDYATAAQGATADSAVQPADLAGYATVDEPIAAAHIADAADAHDASAISILDTANDFTATDVEGALAELQADAEADATALSDHAADTTSVHGIADTSALETTSGAQAKADAKVTQTITNGVTTTAPSEDAVFDALALKADDSAVVHDTGDETIAGIKTITDGVRTASVENNLGSHAYLGLFTGTAAVVQRDPSTVASATQGAASQTANLHEWRDNAGTPLASVSSTGEISVPDEVYGAGWNGSLEVPTKNAVYDKIETIGGGTVDDTAYDATSWNGVTGTAPSKNAVRDKVELLAPLASPTFTGTPAAPTAAQGTNTTQVASTAYVQTEVGLLTAFKGCRAYRSAALSLTNDTVTAIGLDAESHDTIGMHDNATNNTRFTVPAGYAGYWQVSGQVAYAFHATGVRGARVHLNGSAIAARNIGAHSANGVTSDVGVTVLAAVGDYFELGGYQNSTTTLALAVGTVSTYLEAVFLGT